MHYLLLCVALAVEFGSIYSSLINEAKASNVSKWKSPHFCKVLSKYMNYEDAYKKVFQEITQYSLIRKIHAHVDELPVKLIQFNRKSLLENMKRDGFSGTEIQSYALMFYHNVGELYKMLPGEISFETVDQYMQELMIFFLTSGSKDEIPQYTAADLRLCFRSNNPVPSSVNIFRDKSVEWFETFSPGLIQYLNLRRMLELTEAALDSGPSKSCLEGMKELSAACENTNMCYALSSEQQCCTPCYSYCLNIIRGCLAPYVLFIPRQFPQLNEQAMSNNNSQSYVSDMHASLNATTVYHLIKNGLKEVKEKSASIQLKLEQFCGRSKSRKLEVATVLSSNSYNNESYRNHIEIIFNSNFHSMEYNNLSSFLAEFIDDLNAFLRNRFDIVQYGRSIEALYCSHMDESQCWNGSTFGRYMRKVPEFSVKGQLNNPEVKITSDELMSQIFQAKNKRKDPPKVFMNNDISSSDRKANQNKRNGENLHVRESSGMHPQFLSTDLDLPKMELYISESKPSEPYSQGEHRPEGVTSDALPDQIVVQGCFMDDEDCDLHFSDTHIDDQNNNEQYNLSSGNASHNYLLQSKENAQDDWQHGNNLTEPTQENGTNVKRLVNSTELNNATTFQLPESTASNNEKSFFVINFVCIFLSIAFRMNIKL